MKIVRENISNFKRGQYPGKSLEIGKYKKIDPESFENNIEMMASLPLGKYLFVRNLGLDILYIIGEVIQTGEEFEIDIPNRWSSDIVSAQTKYDHYKFRSSWHPNTAQVNKENIIEVKRI